MTPERFADIYRSERKALARSIARISGPDQAEDLVHDAFVAYLVTDPEANRPGAWLSRVARNRALNHVRRPRALPLTPSVERDADENPGLEAEREATRSLVAATLAGLGERPRVALQLRFFEGRSYEEVAAALGVRVSQAHVVVHRALRRFGRELVRRIAEAHGAEGCAETISSLAGITAGDAEAEHGIASCARCRNVWEEIVALRSLPSLVPLLPPLRRMRAALDGVWRRGARVAEPVGQALAAAGIAASSMVGATHAAPAAASLARSAPVVASQPAARPAASLPAFAGVVAPRAGSLTQSRETPVTTTKVADAGPVRVTQGDSHTQVDAGGGSGAGVVVCEPLEPCPPE